MAVEKGVKRLVKKAKPKPANKAKAVLGKPRALKKPLGAKPVSKAAGGKSVKRDIKKLKKAAVKVSNRTKRHAVQLELLRQEIEKLKKGKKKKHLSAYNRFMKQQINMGVTFNQAVHLWNRKKKGLAVSTKAVNQKSLALKGAAPKKKPAKQIRPKMLEEVVESMKKEKPKPVPRLAKAEKPKTLTRVKKVGVEKPVVVTKRVFPEKEVAKVVQGALKRARASEDRRFESLKEAIAKRPAAKAVTVHAYEEPSDEDMALRMLSIYFTEVARYRLKRKLTLDEVINAYFYALLRMQRKGIEKDAARKLLLREGM